MPEVLLNEGMRSMGLDPGRPGAAKLLPYLSAMLEENRRLNLTAIKDPGEAVRLHLLDSLAVFMFIDLADKSVIDVGTGGGMPGVALALYEPASRVTLLDATAKKLGFVMDTCRKLGVAADFVNARAEEYAGGAGREAYDVVTARAVAPLPVLAELCLPLLKPGGVFVAYKGAAASAETAAAARAIAHTGGGETRVAEYKLPGLDAARALIIIKKVRRTPDTFPRSYKAIKDKPL